MDEISIDKARPRLGGLVSDAQGGIATCITRNGKPAAVLVPVDRLTEGDRWLITTARAQAAVPAGEGDPWEQVGRDKTLLAGLAAALERLGGPALDKEENHG